MFKNTFADIEYILTTCAENNTRFEIECYDIGHLYTLRHFLDRGVIKPPLFVQSVFGILGGIGTHPEDIIMMKRTADRLLGDNYHWSVLGAGGSQMRVAAMAASMGGNVRVGMEDSLWIGAGRLAESNAQQVTQVRKILEGLGLEIATADEAREILSLKGGDKVAFLVVVTRHRQVARSFPRKRESSSCAKSWVPRWRGDATELRIALAAANPSYTGGRFAHGLPRHLQHRHFARQPAGAGRHSVEPDRVALRRAVAAGVPAGRHAGRRGRPGRAEIQRRRHRLYGRLDRAGADPVRRRLAHALATFRSVLAPAATLATVGVLITTLLIAPVAKFVLGIGWIQALLVGAVVASTDAAAVFLLINARGLRLRPRVRATLEVESGTNDPFAVFLTLLLVEFLLVGEQGWSHALVTFLRDAVLGCIIGYRRRAYHHAGAQPARRCRRACTRRSWR